MRLFFKYIAVFLALSLQIFSQEETKYVKVEVASLIWKNQSTNESFPKVENFSLANEILVPEIPKMPEINLDTIELTEGQVKIDFEFVDEIFVDTEGEVLIQEETFVPPKVYRLIDVNDHELNGTMRRISQIKDLELSNHKSWFQPLDNEENTPFILVSDNENQCIVKVFQSRYPRIHAKCAIGTDVLKNSYLMSKSEFNVKPLIGSFKTEKTNEDENNIETEIFILDEQRRISLDEFHYFDHPKIGLLVGVYDYPKEEN
ncbi:MAG: hypothetical protein CBC72_003780 [Gammaproteobacteria bacterium TMED112]|nr:MAG: hypothetical protein CBC72_003780 [Gammaproteobacteria bacterium TMED112]|tara:strand:+ start:780 stop:1559 length:780 start_codon:yes stop_codon:yes gene_type:complete